MLHSYSFSNFRSFRARVEVDLTLTDQAAVNGWEWRSPAGQRLTTALAVLGHNASGKTSLIQPLAFLAWFVRDSFRGKPNADLPLTPHFLAPNLPSEFEAVFDAVKPGVLWRYRLTVTTRHVVAESLEQQTSARGRWTPIFRRKRREDGSYEVVQNDFGLDPLQASAVRPNVSLISWAAQFGVEAKELANVIVITNLGAGGRLRPERNSELRASAQYYAENKQLHAKMRALLQRFDLGLSDVVVTERDFPDQSGQLKKQWFALGVHTHAAEQPKFLPMQFESSGTQALFVLLRSLLHALDTGGLVVYDEFDSDLHPLMLEPLLDLFSDPESNPHGAQIIFTCHAVEVLRLLQKSQVMLVDKDGLESDAWRLDSLEGVRSDENRVAKYLAGAYGAVPRL